MPPIGEIFAGEFLSVEKEGADWREAAALHERLEWARDQRTTLSVHGLGAHMRGLPSGQRPAHVSKAQVDRYHRGQKTPGWDYIQELGRLSGVDPVWMLTGIGTPDGPVRGEDYAAGLRWALERAEATARDVRARLAELESSGDADSSVPLVPEGLLVLGRFKALLEDEAVKEVQPENPLGSAIAFVSEYLRPGWSDDQCSTWQLLLETFEAAGVYDPEDEVRLSDEQVSKIDPALVRR